MDKIVKDVHNVKVERQKMKQLKEYIQQIYIISNTIALINTSLKRLDQETLPTSTEENPAEPTSTYTPP